MQFLADSKFWEHFDAHNVAFAACTLNVWRGHGSLTRAFLAPLSRVRSLPGSGSTARSAEGSTAAMAVSASTGSIPRVAVTLVASTCTGSPLTSTILVTSVRLA